MSNKVYFSPTIKSVFKTSGKLNGNNQNRFSTSLWDEFMLIEYQRYIDVIERLSQTDDMTMQFYTNLMAQEEENRLNKKKQQLDNKRILEYLKSLHEGRKLMEKTLAEQCASHQHLVSYLHNLKDQLDKTKLLLQKNFQHLGSAVSEEFDLQQKHNELLHEQHRIQLLTLTNSFNELKERYEPEKTPDVPFKLGDRITLYGAHGTISTGVFIQSTENMISWVNDVTHQLCLTHKKGLSISKESKPSNP